MARRNTYVTGECSLISSIIGKDIKPIHQEPRPGDIKHSLADISKAKEIGYNPKYDSERGLKETIRGFRCRA